jgi:pyruvate dehydrogenase E2 component (dihydrolipoamide acetyltransferase)
VLAYILAPGEAEISPKPMAAAPALKATADSKPAGRSTAPSDGGFKGDEDGIRATPLARRLAREAGLNLATVSGTGPRGRIDSGDIQHALTARQSQGSISADGILKIRHWAAEGHVRGTMVLVHGFGGNGATWEAIGGDLAKRGFNVYAPDLAGHGRTALEADSFETVVASLEACLANLPGGPLHLVGHSMGAAVAVRAARQLPRKIARLTLLAPFGLGTQIDEGFIRGLAHATTSENVAALLRLLTVRTIGYSPRQLEIMTSEVSQGRLIGLSKLLVANGQQSVTICLDLRRQRPQ